VRLGTVLLKDDNLPETLSMASNSCC